MSLWRKSYPPPHPAPTVFIQQPASHWAPASGLTSIFISETELSLHDIDLFGD